MGCASSTPSPGSAASGGGNTGGRKGRRGTTTTAGLLRSTAARLPAPPHRHHAPASTPTAMVLANPLRSAEAARGGGGADTVAAEAASPTGHRAAPPEQQHPNEAVTAAAPTVDGNATLDGDAAGLSDPVAPDDPLSTSLFEMDLTPSATTPSAASDATDAFERRSTSRVRTASIANRRHRLLGGGAVVASSALRDEPADGATHNASALTETMFRHRLQPTRTTQGGNDADDSAGAAIAAVSMGSDDALIHSWLREVCDPAPNTPEGAAGGGAEDS